MCNITYRGVAVSTPEDRTTVSYDTTFRVHKELLSQILNTVLRVRERDSRQVGDPFITPYLAGVYQRLGLEYSGLICFTRLTLLWRRLASARASVLAVPAAAAAGFVTARPAARIVSLDWHVQQLHRELIFEPWKAADLRLMLARAAAYTEAQVATGASSSGGGSAAAPACAAASGGGVTAAAGWMGPWLPRHGSALVGGGMQVGSYSASGGTAAAASGGGGPSCDASSQELAVLGRADGAFAIVLFWAMWLACPTMLVALEALQAAPDNTWMALYICVIATCRTRAEWRAAAALALSPGLTPVQRLYGMAAAHAASGLAAAAVTGLLNTWLPLLGHDAAAAVVWLHLLLLPAVAVAVMGVAGMPTVARQLAGGRRTSAAEPGGAATRRNSGGRDRRTAGHIAAGGGSGGREPLAAVTVRRATREGDRGGSANGGGGGRGGGGASPSAAAAAAASAAASAAVHWPPALEVPAWLDDWPNAPEAFRCPITQALMREPAQASSGVTYERPAIMQWLDRRRVDPVTHVPLKRHRLAPNLNLRHMIEVWVQDRVEARRRLAQRLREEVNAEAAALAAAAEASAAARAPADVAEEAVPTVASTAALDASTARENDDAIIAASAALEGSGAAMTHEHPLDSGGGAAAAARAPAGGGGAAAAARAPADVAVAEGGPVRPATAGAWEGGGTGGAGGGGGGDSGGCSETGGSRPEEGRVASGLQVEQVEALAAAAAAARVRCGCRRHCPSIGGGEGGGGGGQLRGGGSDGADGDIGGDDGGASTAGSFDSPFAAPAEAAQDNSTGLGVGAERGSESGNGGGGSERGWTRLHVYGTAFGAEQGGDGGFGGGEGLRRRRRNRLGSAAAAAPWPSPLAAAGGDVGTAPGGLANGLGWGMTLHGADPDSSGVLAVDGSSASNATAIGARPGAGAGVGTGAGAGGGGGASLQSSNTSRHEYSAQHQQRRRPHFILQLPPLHLQSQLQPQQAQPQLLPTGGPEPYHAPSQHSAAEGRVAAEVGGLSSGGASGAAGAAEM